MRQTITIDSIFEGFMPSKMFGASNEYLSAIGIDPDMPVTDAAADVQTGGFIRPVNYAVFSSTEVDAAPIAILSEPKSNCTWVVLTNGKIVLYDESLTSAKAQSIGQVTGSSASGAFYYNNYIYITGTGTSFNDISVVGPLNTLPYDAQSGNFTIGLIVTGGTSGATAKIIADVDAGTTGTLTLEFIDGFFQNNETITDTSTGSATVNRTNALLITNAVWTGAMLGSQTALTNWKPPAGLQSTNYLNHHGFAHTDGAAYVLDFLNGLGMIHKIQTTKTTNEGDTNNGSAYQSVGTLSLPRNYFPITACSFGTDIVISGAKTFDPAISQGGALLSFWNSADELFYRHVILPDPICTALTYVNGILYGMSGSLSGGYRLFRYVGGDAIETLKVIADGHLPMQNAITAFGNRIIWAADTATPFISSGLYAFGSKSDLFPRGLHDIATSDFI